MNENNEWTIWERILICLSRDPADVSKIGYYEEPTKQWDENPLALLRSEFSDFNSIIKDKKVLDYGCGDGFQALAILDSGARYVMGVDLSEQRLRHARHMVSNKENIEFSNTIRGKFDVVISQNAIEHFSEPGKSLAQMTDSLAEGGRILITFGPPWFAPYGAHMHFFTKVPWVHLLWSEKSVWRVQSRYRDDGGTMKYKSGLNEMSIRKFESLIEASGLKAEWTFYHAVKNMNLLAHIPILRELFINQVSCILTRKGALVGDVSKP